MPRLLRPLGALLVALTLLALAPATAPAGAQTTVTPVMGTARLTAAQLAGWFRSTGIAPDPLINIDELAAHFISEGRAEGVAGDLAFAQSIVETGYFRFSARVPASFHNYAGIGAVDAGTGANAFRSPQIGVRAQIQHLRAYADPTVTPDRLANPLESPRFRYVLPKGKAPTWEQFGNGNWATDPAYAGKVLAVYQRMVSWAASNNLPAITWTPFSSAEHAVVQAYVQVAGRTVSGTEKAAAVARLSGAELTTAGLFAELAGPELARTAAPGRLYLAALGRVPDLAGVRWWADRADAGHTPLAMARDFLASSEFAARFGVLGGEDYLHLLYTNVLGRPADAAGLAYWTARLAGGLSRANLLLQFAASPEHIASAAPALEAAHLYQTMLGRGADRTGITWWSAQRQAGAQLEQLVSMILRSEEYRRRLEG